MSVLEIGFALYLDCGISIADRVLIATNTFLLVATTITLSIDITYHHP